MKRYPHECKFCQPIGQTKVCIQVDWYLCSESNSIVGRFGYGVHYWSNPVSIVKRAEQGTSMMMMAKAVLAAIEERDKKGRKV